MVNSAELYADCFTTFTIALKTGTTYDNCLPVCFHDFSTVIIKDSILCKFSICFIMENVQVPKYLILV